MMLSLWFWTLFVVVALVVVLFLKKRGKKVVDNTGPRAANIEAKPAVSAPGNGAPCFVGLRVLELTEVVAAPLACRTLASFGADVIKVEKKGTGDLCRVLLAKQFERDRPWASAFDTINTSKRSIDLDLKTKNDKAFFKKLIANADILVTNVRKQALARMGLTYEDLHKDYPGLIYAHLSAYGTTGPEAESPGFDTSSFFVNTGISEAIHRPGIFNMYPAGWGDSMGGSCLVSGVSMALRVKLETGLGMEVGTSLFKIGLFLQSQRLVQEKAKKNEGVPQYKRVDAKSNPLQAAYECDKGQYLFVGMYDTQDAMKKLESKFSGISRLKGTAIYQRLRSEFLQLDRDDALNMLRGIGIDCQTHQFEIRDKINPPEDHYFWKHAECYKKSFCSDIPLLFNDVFDMSCSDKHGPRCRAPYLGQHRKEILESGWYERDPSSVIKTAEIAGEKLVSEVYGKKMLDGVSIVEWSDLDCTASTVCVLAADFGAKVTKIVPKGGDYWKKNDVKFYEQLNRGKTAVENDAVDENILDGADVFVTNRPLSELKKCGLDPDTVRSKYPKLVYVFSSPRGIKGDERNRCDYLVTYGEAGMSCWFEPVPPGYVPQMGAIQCGIHLYSGLCSALFHKSRTGEGQLVKSNVLRAAIYSMIYFETYLLRNPDFKDFIPHEADKIDVARYWIALICFHCYKTKDGVWIQCIGTDLLKDGSKLLSALGVWSSVVMGLPKLIFNMATEKGTIFKKLRYLGKLLVPIVEQRVAKMTLKEVGELFDKKNVWWSLVGVGDQMRYQPQVEHLKVFEEHENGFTYLKQPIMCENTEEVGRSSF